MNQPRLIIVGFETFNCFLVVVSRSWQTFYCALCGSTSQGLLQYTSFSESDKLGWLCTDTLNCSQKFLQLRMFSLNTETFNLGSLTPFASVGAGADVVVDDAGECVILIQREQVNISFSKWECSAIRQTRQGPMTSIWGSHLRDPSSNHTIVHHVAGVDTSLFPHMTKYLWPCLRWTGTLVVTLACERGLCSHRS